MCRAHGGGAGVEHSAVVRHVERRAVVDQAPDVRRVVI